MKLDLYNIAMGNVIQLNQKIKRLLYTGIAGAALTMIGDCLL